MLNEDYRDMLQSLADEKAKFLLVGAYALAAHGYPRAIMRTFQSPGDTHALSQQPGDGGSLGHIRFRALHGFFGRRQIISEIGVDVDAYAHISRAGRKPGSPP